MNLKWTREQKLKLAAANIEASKLVPLHYKDIPEGAVVLAQTEDPWINEQNKQLAERAIKEGKPVRFLAVKTIRAALI